MNHIIHTSGIPSEYYPLEEPWTTSWIVYEAAHKLHEEMGCICYDNEGGDDDVSGKKHGCRR